MGMSGGHEFFASELVRLYGTELSLYRSMLALALEVKNLLEADRYELEDLVSEQARLTGEIDRLEEQAVPLRRSLAQHYGRPDLTLAVLNQWSKPDVQLQSLREILSQVARMLDELSKVYASNQRLMEARLGAVRADQAALAKAKQAAQAYHAPGGGDPAPRFLDKRS